MASPLRSWSPLRPGRAGGAVASRRLAAGAVARSASSRVEFLESRQFLSASLVSIDTSGLAGGSDDSQDPDLSGTGRFVAFTSRATDLATDASPADTNNFFDVYLRDLQTGETTLVSVSAAGTAAGNNSSTDPSVSDDGRFVAFASDANNLVAGDNNNRTDVFVRDLFNNTTRLVSVNLTNTGPGNNNSLQPSVSGDGSVVAFVSDATNLAPNDLTATRDVLVRDLTANTTTLVSLSVGGTGGNAASSNPFVSSDGRFITYVSDATDLLGTNVPTPVGAGAGTAGTDVFLRDTRNATTALVSTTNGATGGSVDVSGGGPTVSADGRFVAFTSTATDLTAGDANGLADVFRKDTVSGGVTLISQSSASVQANGASARPKISADGRFVSFSSTASNLAAPDSGSGPDVFIRDVDQATTTLVSVSAGGNGGTGSSSQPSMNDDGSLVAFVSEAQNLVDEQIDNADVFVATTAIPGNDQQAPTLFVPPQPISRPQAPEVGETFLPFVLIFDDNTFVDTSTLGNLDVVVTGPNGFSAPATLFALVSTINTSATVQYTVPAPGGTLSFEDNGTYTVTVNGNQVGDLARNFVSAGTTGTFELNLPIGETVLPAPTFSGGSPAVGSPTYEFTVVYSERGGIEFADFGNDDLQVVGPNGFSQNATFVSQVALNATQNSVIYRITAPGGTWDATDAGVYSVNVIPGGVRDVARNVVQAGTIGQFTGLGADLVAIPVRGLRSGAISGVDPQKAKIRILNQGTNPTTVPVAVTLYTSLDTTLDAGDATIGTFIEERPIGADDFNQISVRFTYPQVPAGDYYVIAQVDSANAVIEQSETNNVIASFQKVGLSAPFVDLVPTLVPFSGNRSRLGTNEVTVKIRNAGNVQATGDVLVALTAISDVTPNPSERPVANVGVKLSLKPGQSKTFRLPFTFPLEFERGTYRMVATIDSSNVIPERDEVNNRVISLASFSFA